MTLAGNWTLDAAHSTIGFTARHAMVTKVHGSFGDFDATITVDAENPQASSAQATIRTASVDTGNADRDAHVKNEDFFDVERFPEMTFSSTSFDIDTTGNAASGTVTGDLTIKGTTRPVTLDVEVFGVEEDPFGNTRIGFEASTTINRKDFGIDFQAPLGSGGVLVSEKIAIAIDGSGIKA
ncbi:YceI family protein [Corynebacterium uberis]|uniref:YceI family protein n=1 Tax=Corynebacterium TaxID=1716 RepID=UPI001D0B213F|nr:MULTISPECIES: YceI family protein [Corynebacterium]MCZ9308998.1 YceI family protein [Corynebacterium sp. c6VSa_13]UDL74534.1 YceI family protein [Corynebacterium uberis]UDL76632.1 YceI family protein [Corynebacterium uberis]UDL78845.1 YceI family protein [Corynebacterium uberis]UDL81123.1 YceI family protein [Corynebacterium uberis]